MAGFHQACDSIWTDLWGNVNSGDTLYHIIIWSFLTFAVNHWRRATKIMPEMHWCKMLLMYPTCCREKRPDWQTAAFENGITLNCLISDCEFKHSVCVTLNIFVIKRWMKRIKRSYLLFKGIMLCVHQECEDAPLVYRCLIMPIPQRAEVMLCQVGRNA